jgi:hypothetical protein
MWRARFGRGIGPVVRQTAKWMNLEKIQIKLKCGNNKRHFTWKTNYIYGFFLK